MKQFGKIFKFEFNGYLKNKVFVGITVFFVIAIAVCMFIPNIIAAFSSDAPDEGGTGEPLPVMLIASEQEGLADVIVPFFASAFADYEVKGTEETVNAVKAKVESGEVECAFVFDSLSSYTYYVENLSMYDMNAEIASTALKTALQMDLMQRLGLSPEQAAAVLSATVESRTETLGKNQMDNFFYTYIMIFALYMVILLYGQMVATNVATEKSSRAMEVLVTTAKPTSMMFGKVLASCLAGFTQLVLIFGSAILFYNINRANLDNPIISSIFDIPIELFIYMIVFFILGFLIYAFLFGAIGSTASKLEDINTSVMPITFLFIIGFMVVMFSMAGGSIDNVAMKICSYVPFTSPMAMFTRIAMSTVAWYEIAISIVLLAGSVVGIGVLSARIYRVGVLLYGTPPKLTKILKAVFADRKRV
ncbi:MAG: ABC transporter permease [Clostridia bacterium]|nr:ABC transporter permease [Clostridia bacterium]